MDPMDPLPDDSVAQTTTLFRSRLAVYVAFFLAGVGVGIWATHIPIVQSRLGIDPGVLGLAIFVMAGAAIAGMPAAGWALARYGSRLPTGVTLIAFTALTPIPILAGSVPFFFAAVLVFGLTIGALDVSMNLQATEIEAARRRPTMSSFHGFFSLGGLAGAGLGGAVIAIGWGDGSGAAIAAFLLLGLAVAATVNLWPSAQPIDAGPRFVLPSRAVLALGLLAFLSFAVEGAVTDWSALYLSSVKGASVAGAAAAFAAFSITMAIFRLVGDFVVTRLGERPTLVAGGALIAAGMGLAVAVSSPALAAAGFALVGVGAANVVPVVFGAASRAPGMPASLGVAAVATLGYVGFLIAPPTLGLVARTFGLSVSLTIVALMGVVIAVVAAMRRWPGGTART
ncbi:MAG: MFS transporter [Bauldia sp.]